MEDILEVFVVLDTNIYEFWTHVSPRHLLILLATQCAQSHTSPATAGACNPWTDADRGGEKLIR